MNKAVLILLLCYALLQSSCSDMVMRSVRVGDKKMVIGFQKVMLEKDPEYNALNERRLGKNEKKPYVPQKSSNIKIYLPQTPTDTIVLSEVGSNSNKSIAEKEDFRVYYNLGNISKVTLIRAIRNKLRGTLNMDRVEFKALNGTGKEVFYMNKVGLTKWYDVDGMLQFIDKQPHNTKILIDISFVTIPPKVIGGISNLCVLTLTD